MKTYDAIVVGAGPSGAGAAVKLAQLGRDVLLLDRYDFPREKPCGEGISPGTLDILFSLGMRKKIEAANFYPIDALRFVTPSDYVMDASLSPKKNGTGFCTATRQIFDRLIQEHAIESGAEFRQANVTSPIIQNGKVAGVIATENGKDVELRSKVVIGADGVSSVIGRSLRTEKHNTRHQIVSMRAYIENFPAMPNRVEFHWYDEILPCCAWVFPISDTCVNVGIAMRTDQFHKHHRTLDAIFNDFLERPTMKSRMIGNATVVNKATWSINLGSQKNVQRVFDGAILIGDAAAFVDPLNYEGIHNGLISAMIAAEVIDESIRKNDFSKNSLKSYESKCNKQIGGIIRRSFLLQRVIFQHAKVIDLLIRFTKTNIGIFETIFTKLSTNFKLKV